MVDQDRLTEMREEYLATRAFNAHTTRLIAAINGEGYVSCSQCREVFFAPSRDRGYTCCVEHGKERLL